MWSYWVYNIMYDNVNSTFHGLNLAAVHEQEKWHHHFKKPGIERRRDLLMVEFNLAK